MIRCHLRLRTQASAGRTTHSTVTTDRCADIWATQCLRIQGWLIVGINKSWWRRKSILREQQFAGEWFQCSGHRVFRYDKIRNIYSALKYSQPNLPHLTRNRKKIRKKTKNKNRYSPEKTDHVTVLVLVPRKEGSQQWEIFVKLIGFKQGVKEWGSYRWWEWWNNRRGRYDRRIGARGESEIDRLRWGRRKEHGTDSRDKMKRIDRKDQLFVKTMIHR